MITASGKLSTSKTHSLFENLLSVNTNCKISSSQYSAVNEYWLFRGWGRYFCNNERSLFTGDRSQVCRRMVPVDFCFSAGERSCWFWSWMWICGVCSLGMEATLRVDNLYWITFCLADRKWEWFEGLLKSSLRVLRNSQVSGGNKNTGRMGKRVCNFLHCVQPLSLANCGAEKDNMKSKYCYYLFPAYSREIALLFPQIAVRAYCSSSGRGGVWTGTGTFTGCITSHEAWGNECGEYCESYLSVS